MREYTIITVCKNAEKEIGRTIESILSQKIDMNLLELLIIDGLSSDNTKKIVETYQEKAKSLGIKIRFYSEKDDGIYDAMNKGARLANGVWCLYLNAGDIFFNEKSFEYLIKCEKCDYDIIYGDTVFSYNGKYKINKSRNEKLIDYKHGMEFCHQSCIIKKNFLLDYPYSTEYKIAGDCDFFTKAFIKGAHFHYVSEIISIFDKNGVSSNNGGIVIKENEYIKYKYGLIDKSEFEKNTKKADKTIKLRAVMPKIIIKIRHKIIMNMATKNWNTQKEIYEISKYVK